MTSVIYPHVELTDEGVPIISGTRTKVVEVVLDRLAHHWDAEEIRRQHPHLSLAQIYAALAYYHDHQEEMDRDISDRLEKVQRIEKDLGESDVRAKLKRLGKLP